MVMRDGLQIAALGIGAVGVAGAAVLGRRLREERSRFGELLDRERGERVRQEFASRASQLLEAPPDAMTMLDQVAGLAVPDMADLCIVDLLEDDGTLKGVAVRATDPADADALRIQRALAPLDPAGEHPVAVAARTGQSLLLPEMAPQDLSRFASSPKHLELMERLRYRSAIVVPLSARGRTLGVLSLLRFADDKPYDDEDFAVARDLARRAALAVDNARLFGDLRRAEGQLETILENLSEAVTVQDASGELVYANQAAADIMGAATAAELLATPVAEIAQRYWQFDEDGEPFPHDAYPGRLALDGQRPEPVVMRQVDRSTLSERWVRLAATPIEIEGGERLAVTVTEDITDVVHSERAARFLATASKLFGSSLDVASTIEKVAWAVVPEVADYCAVHLPDSRGRMRRAALAWMQAEPPDIEAPDPAPVMRTGQSRLVSSSTLIAPLVAGDETVGTITLATTGPDRRLGPGDLHLAEELGRRAGVAIENARVHEARSHIATTLQRSLLPPRLPDIPGLTTAARFRAAGISSEVGGDFYDLFPAAGGWMMVIGDVTGKGPAAAAITSLARYTLRTAALYERLPERTLDRLNDVLLADAERRRLCTAICAHIAPQGDRIRIRLARAGHPAPYLVRQGAGAQPVGRPGTLLGAFEEVAWSGDDLELLPGDMLVLYTDGVTDTTSGAARFGQERVAAVLDDCAGLDPEDVARRIDAALQAFEKGPQRDDQAILVLRADAVSR